MDDHSSRRTVTCTLQQPTRGVLIGTGRSSPLIWPCSSWGLPCRCRYRQRGALLPHHFTLTRTDASIGRRRCIFCGTFRHAAAILPLPCAQALPGSLPYGARTFLEQTLFRTCLAIIRSTHITVGTYCLMRCGGSACAPARRRSTDGSRKEHPLSPCALTA